MKAALRVAGAWGVLGTASIGLALPYVLALQGDLLQQAVAESEIPLPALLAIQVVQGGVLMFVAALLGARVGPSLGLHSPLMSAWVAEGRARASARSAGVSALVGLMTGGAIVALDWGFQGVMPPLPEALATRLEPWKGFLASFYGGVGEELLMRMGLMTILSWVTGRLLRRPAASPGAAPLLVGIVLAAVVFGLAHLPAAATIWPLSPVVVVRTLVLNSVGGVVFGMLFWRRGLEYAMGAHFCTDLVLHVLVPALSS